MPEDSPRKVLDEVEGRDGEQLLTREQKDFYAREGYLKLDNFFAGKDLEDLTNKVVELQNIPEKKGLPQMLYFEDTVHGRQHTRIEDFCRHDDWFKEHFMTQSGKVMRVLHELYGESMELFKDKINFKLPGGDGFKAHQDQAAGWDDFISWSTSVALFIDRSTEENGYLEVAGGYHKNGLLGEKWEPIENLPLPYKGVPCNPGDFLLFDSYVPHRSAKNDSDKPRRAMFLTYSKSSEGFKLPDYYAEKRVNYPPDIERDGKKYVYRV